ncbi:MAG: hypothetical protein RQ824_00375 [bacterium]|nr:hypothetical protein [bacterium]
MKKIISTLPLILIFIACSKDGESEAINLIGENIKTPSKITAFKKMPKQMRHCTPCHTIKREEKHKIGPRLFGIVGKEVGSQPGYRYSDEYKEGKWLWTRDNLDILINRKYGTLSEAVKKLTGNPEARTKMKFYGADDDDAQIILDYLETLE